MTADGPEKGDKGAAGAGRRRAPGGRGGGPGQERGGSIHGQRPGGGELFYQERRTKTGYITVARVAKPHGCHGEVRVWPLTDFPDRLVAMRRVTVEKGSEHLELRVEGVRRHGNAVLMKFAGIDDPETARAYQGARLVVTREELVPLPEDSYYVFDLVGLKVYTAQGRELGVVSDVVRTGAHDLWVVDRPTGRPLLVPALKRVVRRVDPPGGRVEVDLPPGLEEV